MIRRELAEVLQCAVVLFGLSEDRAEGGGEVGELCDVSIVWVGLSWVGLNVYEVGRGQIGLTASDVASRSGDIVSVEGFFLVGGGWVWSVVGCFLRGEVDS